MIDVLDFWLGSIGVYEAQHGVQSVCIVLPGDNLDSRWDWAELGYLPFEVGRLVVDGLAVDAKLDVRSRFGGSKDEIAAVEWLKQGRYIDGI